MTWMQGNKSCNYWDFIFSFHSNLHTHTYTQWYIFEYVCVWTCVTCIWTSIYFNTWFTVWLSVYLPPLFLLPRWLHCRFFYSYPAGYVHVILTYFSHNWLNDWVSDCYIALAVCVLSPPPAIRYFLRRKIFGLHKIPFLLDTALREVGVIICSLRGKYLSRKWHILL